MITDYKNQGARVDEVLFQEVTKVVNRAKKAEALLQRLYYEMGKSADSDMKLWGVVKSYVKGRDSE